MMNLILDRQQPGSVVSETILEETVSRTWEIMEMFELLMKNEGSDIPITDGCEGGSEQAVCIPID